MTLKYRDSAPLMDDNLIARILEDNGEVNKQQQYFISFSVFLNPRAPKVAVLFRGGLG